MEKIKLFKDVSESEMKPGFQFKESNRSYKVYTVIGFVKDEECDKTLYVIRYLNEQGYHKYEFRSFWKK